MRRISFGRYPVREINLRGSYCGKPRCHEGLAQRDGKMDFVAKPNDKRMLTPCRINCDCRGFIRAIKIRRYSGIGTTLVVGDGERATPNFGIRR